jgi:hypothetical protein
LVEVERSGHMFGHYTGDWWKLEDAKLE